MSEEAAPICTPSCWQPVRCEHDREMTPISRSVALEMPVFCYCYQDPEKNQRHLWSEHDDTRSYADPAGWAAHVAACKQCRGDDDD